MEHTGGEGPVDPRRPEYLDEMRYGTRTARRGDHDVRCADHPHRTMPCPECRRGIPCPPDVAAQVREQIRAGITHHHKRASERAERSTR